MCSHERTNFFFIRNPFVLQRFFSCGTTIRRWHYIHTIFFFSVYTSFISSFQLIIFLLRAETAFGFFFFFFYAHDYYIYTRTYINIIMQLVLFPKPFFSPAPFVFFFFAPSSPVSRRSPPHCRYALAQPTTYTYILIILLYGYSRVPCHLYGGAGVFVRTAV